MLKENLEKIRTWIDGTKETDITADILKAHEKKSASELLLQKLLQAVEQILNDEITRIPNTSKAYVPEKFLVYLSEATGANLPEDKRKFFEQSLSVLILERAKELAGKFELTAKKIRVEIMINAVLDEDEIEVKVCSDHESTKSKTIEFVQTQEKSTNTTLDESGTLDDFDAFTGVLYRVEIWQTGKKINEIPIVQTKVTVGRDDAEKAANLRLPTDNRKISRRHAEMQMDANKEIWVTALHKNPTIVSGKPIKNKQKAKIEQDGEIQIYDFTLKIKTAN